MNATHLPCVPPLAMIVLFTLGAVSMTAARAEDPLERVFASPPREARLRAYWWWLNGNVTAEAITRDLEEMAAKGFGGALICDAGGAEQDGNDRVPAGPTFFSPEWRELYRHALREADRLGLEMSLNIQSGWNLGGPMVEVEDAPKRLVWSEMRISGPTRLDRPLDKPKHPREFYRDVAVLAYPVKPQDAQKSALAGVAARSAQAGFPAERAVDADPETFWVSGGGESGQGPSRQAPEWIDLEFASPVEVDRIELRGRPGYGPRECELQISNDGNRWRKVKAFEVGQDGRYTADMDKISAARFRLLIFSAFDPRYPDAPRNAQVAEFALLSSGRNLCNGAAQRRLLNWEQKAMHRIIGRSAPDTTPLLEELPGEPGDEHVFARDVVDLTSAMDADGHLKWDVPAGEWEILRFGSTLNHRCRVSTCSDGWNGYALDPFDAGAFDRYWHAVVAPLIADAEPLAGRVLKYLHTDSWEVGVANWTPTLREEFRERCGYDLLAYLPAIAGRIVDSRDVSNRFLHDLRKTMGDLAVDNHYRLFSGYAREHGLQLHPESGGPHAVPVDSLRCLGMDDVPMSEFWARSWRHRVSDQDRFFVKQPASAAHTYGRRLVKAEGFTTIGPHWQETLWDNLKPSFDRALCEGLNLLAWHAFTCSPAEMGLPGQEYFAGTHFNPNSTWWSRSASFLAYINRCQALLQRGLFVADAVYYYGDHVPNFTQLRSADPARVLPGYDYDVATEEVVLTRMDVRDGRIVLPDGMSYRVLVLPDRPAISPAVLSKVHELVAGGATVIGPRPQRSNSLKDHPAADEQVQRLADELWGDCDGQAVKEHRFGRGRVIWNRTARKVLLADGIGPDFQTLSFTMEDADEEAPTEPLNYIHRRDDGTDIYFVCNGTDERVTARVQFRVSGKAPELWDPLSGRIRRLPAYEQADAHTAVPLEFAPFGSWFLVFRQSAETATPTLASPAANFPRFTQVGELAGPWTARFDPQWGGAASVEFPELANWTQHSDRSIRFYSGTATYIKTFDWSSSAMPTDDASRVYLDLGRVCQLAEVRLNGHQLGVLWAMPFRVDITDALRPGANDLEIDVVSFWPNRIIGDAALPPAQRRTRTNIRKLTAETPLMDSGLLGPVTMQIARR